MTGAVLEVTDLKKHFPVEKGLLRTVVAHVKAVDGVSFAIRPGETLCLVGESGCGKSTVGKLALGLIPATAGSIRLDGEDITGKSRGQMQPYRKRIQMVFQDPSASLNPRLTAGTIVGEPMENYAEYSASERQARVEALFAKVGCGPTTRCASTVRVLGRAETAARHRAGARAQPARDRRPTSRSRRWTSRCRRRC